MKTSHNNKLLLILTLSLILASCRQEGDTPKSKALGTYDAGIAESKIHVQYLGCYPLGNEAKKECLEPLTNIHKKDGKDEEYIQAFQFESEKQGFKFFLNKHYLPCKYIEDGPEYIDNIQAYLVTCSPLHHYVMAFDYEKSEWKLLQRKDL